MRDPWKEYVELRDAALEGRATADEIDRLQSLVLDSEEMKRDYAQHVHQQAAIAWHVTESPDQFAPTVSPAREASVSSSKVSYVWLVAASAAAVLITIGATWLWNGREEPAGFAMITASERCQWGECSQATAENVPLGEGRMRLQSGIATLRFPYVNINLEGAVDLEIVNEKKCVLHSGRVFADVEPGGEGFELQTPTAVFVDQGTTFGVSVLPSGTSDLRVFSGRVDVDHAASGTQLSVRTDEHVRVSATKVGRINGVEPTFKEQPSPQDDATRPLHLSTATGLGDDVYVMPQPHPPENRSTEALLVKRPPHATPGDWGYPWRRKAFLKFDMSLLGDVVIEEAELHLHGVDTQIGFASLMPDATFSVYGLTDESQDDWDSESIDWLNCPASSGDALDVASAKAVLLGQFVVPQSTPLGRFEISGAELTEFLNADTNGVATLIIIPETVGRGEAYVHGFASKRHQKLPAPTLRLRVR